MKEVNRKNNFSMLHFLGACLVVYGHQYTLVGQATPSLLGNSVSTFGVKMIFVITGFLITQSFLRSQTPGEFLKRRLIRIFPALAFCLIVTTLAFSLISSLDLRIYFRWSYRYLLSNLVLRPSYNLPGVFEHNPYPYAVNGSLWTIPVEVTTYFILAFSLGLIMKIRDGRWRVRVYSIAVISVVAFKALCNAMGICPRIVVWGTDWFSAMDLIPYMLIGSLFEVADLKKYCNLQLASFAMLAACCLKTRGIECLSLLVLPYFTMSFALCEEPFFSGLFEKNNIAYGVFLWGFPIQQLIVEFLYVKAGVNCTANTCFLLSIIPIIMIALISARYVERPVEQFLKKKLIRKHTI